MFREVVTQGVFYGQPHSEPVEHGQTDTALSVGGRRFGTTARKVDGGYVVNGRKFFVSLAGPARPWAPADTASVRSTARRRGGSNGRCICRCRRTRGACAFPASGTRWACAARSVATW